MTHDGSYNFGSTPRGFMPHTNVPGFMGLGTQFDFGFDFGFGGGDVEQSPPAAAAENADSGGFLDGIGGLKGLGSIAKGLASLGSVYSAIRGLGLAEDQFDFTKRAYQENLANSKQSYNTSLEDRIRARYNTEGRSAGAVQGYLDKHSL